MSVYFDGCSDKECPPDPSELEIWHVLVLSLPYCLDVGQIQRHRAVPPPKEAEPSSMRLIHPELGSIMVQSADERFDLVA